MTSRRLRILLLGNDAARRKALRDALLSRPVVGTRRDAQITEAADPRELVPRPRRAFDVALLCSEPGEDPTRLSRLVAERLPHVPLVSVGDELRPDAEALVASGVEDHVPTRCTQCANSPRLADAIRWAIERRELLEEAERLRLECEARALHDPLTGLANRVLLRDRLHHLLARSARSRVPFALLFVDLDDFKAVNDELGHDAGDRLLCALAGRLAARVRGGDTCARWGGDEFLVLLEDVRSRAAAARVATDVLAALAEPVRVGGRRIRMRASAGVSHHPEDGGDADALIRAADEAMYAAKAAGGGALRHAGAGVRRGE